jgi:opacity protein-like surface antigen
VFGTWPINRTFALEARGGLYFGESKLRGWVSAGFDIDEGDLDWWLRGVGGGNPGLLLGAGVVASYGAHWAVRLSYDYIHGDAVAIRNSDLDAGMDSSAGRVALGLRYLF